MVTKQVAVLNEVPQGAMVVDVIEGSPAEKAGVAVDDIITKFDGQEVKDESGGLADLIAKKKPGDSVSLEVWRDGEIHQLSATLSEFSE